jgi:hypothetical protein
MPTFARIHDRTNSRSGLAELLRHSITCRIAAGPRQGCKVFTLQTLPACDDECDARRRIVRTLNVEVKYEFR